MSVYVTYFIQILLVIHVLKTGRNRYWIWMLLFVPLIGGIAYLVIEILPEFGRGIQGQRTMRGLRNVVNPGAILRRHEAAWEHSPNADNARRYVNALLDEGRYEDADKVLDKALSGFFSTEPNLLLLKARSRIANDDPAAAVEVFEMLLEANPEFRSAEGHLLYAQALEASGRMDQALQEYRSVCNYFPGVEARYRLALALMASGQEGGARGEFEQLINDARLAPAHFRKSQKKWLALAGEQLKKRL